MREPVSRRTFIEGAASVAIGASASLSAPHVARAARRPNFLFIAVDDLNDWIRPLGGYRGVQTPNFDRLARKARVYRNAYSPVPVCSGARSAVLFGVEPFHSGVYTQNEEWQRGSLLRGQTSLPRFMRDQGYFTIGTGKVFHGGWRADGGQRSANDPKAWDHYEYCEKGACDVSGKDDEEGADVIDLGQDLAFGENDLRTTEMPDVLRADWLCKTFLQRKQETPFFAAIGLQKPHLPFAVPGKWFDLYPEADIRYPPGVLDPVNDTLETNRDVADLPPAAFDMLRQFGTRDHAKLTGGPVDLWKPIIRAYLAAISFTDWCLGRVLDGVLKGPNASDTIIVLWSDHGWQLGEKLGWRKFTLWERATRVPLMIGGPGIRKGASSMPVSLIDLFPTIADLAFGAVPTKADLGGLPLDGASMARELRGGRRTSDLALSTWMLDVGEPDDDETAARHFSVRTDTHRLIAYGNGDRELYDHRVDPYEFNNLMANPDGQSLGRVADMLRALPDPADCAPRARKGKQNAAIPDETTAR